MRINSLLSPANSTQTAYPPEVEEGNFEYKLKLLNPSPNRLEHLITQMKWRLKEGEGEALYAIGVEDNGSVSGLLREELDFSLATLKKMADRLEAEIRILKEQLIEKENQPTRYAVEVLVKQIPTSQEFIGIRVACIGNVDVGKSTLLGVLSHGCLDNGRGRARLNMFRHLHEIQTGHTSSISHEILGFDADGNELNYRDLTAEEICASAARLITFLDLAGHHKYLKTTILGLTGYSPDLVMLVVAANRGVAGTTKEHLGLAIALKIPFIIVVTKTDVCSAEKTNQTIKQLETFLRSPCCKKNPIVVQDEEHAAITAECFSLTETPIFKVSNVTGRNLDLLRKFYASLPQDNYKKKELIDQPTEFQIDEIFTVCDVGPVLGGTLRSGTIRVGDKLLVGPMSGTENPFVSVTVASVHRNRTPCSVIHGGQTACIAVQSDTDCTFRRGQVLLDEEKAPKSYWEIEVELFLLFHTTKIGKEFQGTLHIGSIIQTATVKEIDKGSVTTGQKAKVKFRFNSCPEYIQEGDKIFFREGRSKGIGEVTACMEACVEA